jgi:hypothetical protein
MLCFGKLLKEYAKLKISSLQQFPISNLPKQKTKKRRAHVHRLLTGTDFFPSRRGLRSEVPFVLDLFSTMRYACSIRPRRHPSGHGIEVSMFHQTTTFGATNDQEISTSHPTVGTANNSHT